jgi:hypothetical protein
MRQCLINVCVKNICHVAKRVHCNAETTHNREIISFAACLLLIFKKKFDGSTHFPLTAVLHLYNSSGKVMISLLEQPEVYIFARSQSSVKHQMLYTPYRANDLKELMPSLAKSGRHYESIMRIGIGRYWLKHAKLSQCCFTLK